MSEQTPEQSNIALGFSREDWMFLCASLYVASVETDCSRQARRDMMRFRERIHSAMVRRLADAADDSRVADWEHRAKVAERKLERIYQRALKTENTADAADLRGFCLGINASRWPGEGHA